MVIEAGVELTLKAGGSFIKLDPGGITVSGPLARINAGRRARQGLGNQDQITGAAGNVG